MRMRFRLLVACLVLAALLSAHPMGNFSVNHYARIEVGSGGVSVVYALDLAEIPSFELLQKWGLAADAPPAELERKAEEEARGWAANLSFLVNGRAVRPHLEKTALAMDKGAGGMPG